MTSDIQSTAKKYGFEERLSKDEDGGYYHEEYVGQTMSYGSVDEKFVFKWKDGKCVMECYWSRSYPAYPYEKYARVHVFDSFEDAITQIWESPRYVSYEMPFLESYVAAYQDKQELKKELDVFFIQDVVETILPFLCDQFSRKQYMPWLFGKDEY